jgi:hypothetical protein
MAIVIPMIVIQGAFMAATIVIGAYTKIMAFVRVITGIVMGYQIAHAAVIEGNTAATAALAFVTKEAAVATGIWSFVMKTATKIQKSLTGKTIGQIAVLAAQTIATGAATAAQWALNIAMNANPVGLIIIGIAALITIIVLLVKNWNKVTAAIKEHSNKIMMALTILFGPIGFIISMIKEVVSNFGRIKEALAATGLFDKIKEIGEGIRNFFGSIGEKILSVWNTVKTAISNLFGGIADAVMSKIGPVINWIVNAWHTATSAIGGFFKGITDAVYNFVKPALDWFSEKWQEITAFFKDNAIINAIKVIGGTLLSGLLAPVQGLLEILSYIPGLGHLAGKGAEKIEEFRNYLKGVDGATVTADINVPNEVEAELAPPVNNKAPSAFDLDMLNFTTGADAGGMSKLHGVVDISGGAFAAPISGGQTYTAGDAADTYTASAAMPAIPETLTSNVAGIAAVLRRIDASVSEIARNLPVSARSELSEIRTSEIVTRTSLAVPRVKMSGEDEDSPNYYNPRTIAPVTQAERMAYNLQERRETIVIEVAAEKGTAARIVRAPRDVDIRLVTWEGA